MDDSKLAAYLDALSPELSIPRKREYFLASAALALAFIWANNMSFADELNLEAAEKHARVYRVISHAEHQRCLENAERFAKAVAAGLNGKPFGTEDTVAVCRVRHVYNQQAAR